MKTVIVLFFLCLFCFSQELITLEKVIEYSLENSYEIKIAKNEAMITDNNTSLGAAGLLPSIVVNSGYNGSISNSEFEFNSFIGLGDSINSEIQVDKATSLGFSSSIGLNYTLFNGFSGIYTLKKFKYLDNLSTQNIRYEIENKIIEVVIKYYEYLNKKNLHNLLKETYDISLDRYERSFERAKYGSASNLELLISEIDLNTDLINFNNSRVDVLSSQNDLFLLMGVSDTTFVFDENVVFNNNINEDNLQSKQKKNNSSVLMAQLNYDIAKQDLKISKAKLSPKIDVTTSFSFNNISSETSFISKQTDRGVFGVVNIQFPIFTGSVRKRNIKNAKLNLESKSFQLENIRKTIETSLTNSYNMYNEGLKNLDIQKEILNTVELNFKKSKELYLLGQLNGVQFREAQLSLLNFKINYSSTLFNTKIQEYILYQFSGMLINRED